MFLKNLKISKQKKINKENEIKTKLKNMPQRINFSDYKASGVYFVEIDNSIVTSSNVQTALRLAVGFNMQGPFNRPVYISNTAECDKLFGGIDRKLERRGCFTNRNLRTMVRKAPVFALNLLNVDTSGKADNKDTVGSLILSFDPNKDSSVFKNPYAFMYDRTKFWIADDQAFVNNTFVKDSQKIDASVSNLNESAFMGLANCGTKDISIIVKKSENLTGYNVTFLDYYGSQDKIPYSWINPNDFVSDYFIDVIAISGNWDKSQYPAYAGDVVWGNFFTNQGLKKEQLNKFLRLDAVNVVGTWTGCILPNFLDKQGNIKSIDYQINKTCNETGLMFAVNQHAMDYVSLDGSTFFFDVDGSGTYNTGDSSAIFIPDFVGNLIKPSMSKKNFTYMSCNIEISNETAFDASSLADEMIDSSTMFTLSSANGTNVNVGDYVRAKSGLMTKIIKKRGGRLDPEDETSAVVYRYTAADIVLGDSAVQNIEIHKSYSDMYKTLTLYSLPGLKICNRHMPGFDADGVINAEAGVKKIYSMLEDQGIRKGLLNNDSFDFRYIVDTLANGLDENCGGKVYLSRLASDKKHCTALINAPSMSQFAASDAPFFGDYWDPEEDDRPNFDVAYIPQGGNQNLVYPAGTESFTLPDEENGADHCAVFAPYLKSADGARTILIPPAADISNVFMNKFTGGDPYTTVANTNGILTVTDAFDVEYAFDDTDRGYLEPFGIIPIINRNGTLMIYGDRTAYQIVNSDLNFLHVRELLNTIQISCQSVLNDYVFTKNTPTTRAEITSRLNPILSAMLDSGALLKYDIECDDLNNTKDVIDNKFCIVDIGVWVTQNMEKIVVPITLNRSTTA